MLCGHGVKITIYFLYERQVECLCNAPNLDSLFKWFHVKKIFQTDIFCVFLSSSSTIFLEIKNLNLI